MPTSSNTITHCPKCGRDVVVPSSWAYMTIPTLCQICEAQTQAHKWSKIGPDIFNAIWKNIGYEEDFTPEAIWHCMPTSHSELYVYQMCGEFKTHYRWRSKLGWHNHFPNQSFQTLDSAKEHISKKCLAEMKLTFSE